MSHPSVWKRSGATSLLVFRLRSKGRDPRPRSVAEGVGFEPTVPGGTMVFETIRFGRSRIPPARQCNEMPLAATPRGDAMVPASETPRWRGVNHLALVTPDMDATVRFYAGVLGMRVVATTRAGPMRHYFVEIGPQNTFALFEVKD